MPILEYCWLVPEKLNEETQLQMATIKKKKNSIKKFMPIKCTKLWWFLIMLY